MNSRVAVRPVLHSSALIYGALQVALLSFLFSYYGLSTRDVFRPALYWTINNLQKVPVIKNAFDALRGFVNPFGGKDKPNSTTKMKILREDRTFSGSDIDMISHLRSVENNLPVFTREQLSFFDGRRPSKGTYLAILGRIYDVQKGVKHYGPSGGYHFFAGRDATRAFVSGDFTDQGLTDNIEGLSHQDLLSVLDWIKFYEKDYDLVGFLQGTYYDSSGKPTARLKEVIDSMEMAYRWKEAKAEEARIFPSCNSEWRKGAGGRVWCSKKSGGIERDWSGVPRKLFHPTSKSFRCACVKNFGPPLSNYAGVDKASGRGDLDNPNLKEYDGCNPSSITCKNDDL